MWLTVDVEKILLEMSFLKNVYKSDVIFPVLRKKVVLFPPDYHCLVMFKIPATQKELHIYNY